MAMTLRHRAAALAAAALLLTIGFAVVGGEVQAQVVVRTRAAEVSRPVNGSAVMALPFPAGHLAVHWAGNPEAVVNIATSTDGVTFGAATDVERDEVGEQRGNGETYGAVLAGGSATFVKITSDRPIGRVTVLDLADGERVTTYNAVPGRPAGAAVAQPPTLSRADWGADESLRFDATGKEVWAPTFWPVQKLIVHHTAGQNNDPDPPATIRSIYYYHAVTQGWGDIGYNFLIDEAGHVYEGRHTFDYMSGSSPTEENSSGYGVTAAHAQGYNSGTVGIALLGTLTTQDATPAARSALESLIAWIDDGHAIDPQGASLYTNPVNGTQATFANIAGHRDVAATECPGGTFYSTLPIIRSDVAAMLGATAPAPDFSLSVSPASQSLARGRAASYTVTLWPANGFSGSVALSATRLPAGASATFSPNPATTSSSLTVQTSSATPLGTYTLTVTGTSGSLSHSTTASLQVKRK